MKTITLIAAFILFAGLNSLMAQHPQIYPIPSYDCQLTALNTGFQEGLTHGAPNREKREMDITISSSSTSPFMVYAKVWVVKVNGHARKGPYTVFLNQPLSVPIDHDQWGVVIKCNWNVSASVWID
jgi:hypothetical protein